MRDILAAGLAELGLTGRVPEQAPEQLARYGRLLLEKKSRGEPIELSQLSGELPENTISLLSRILAQNYDVGFTERDVDLYLERVEQSVPKSVEAAQMSGEQLEDYLKQLRERRR